MAQSHWNLPNEKMANLIRQHVLTMTSRAKSSHVGSSFSMVELLTVLYGSILRVRPEEPKWEDRDRFILSKGHACAALYAVLAERGFFSRAWLNDFYMDGAKLAGHATHSQVPGIEISTGSLGHGLSVACGMALAGLRDGKSHRVFALLSDGECDEGSIWEAVLFAAQHRLENLVVIVDYNKVQSLGTVKDVMDLEPFGEKWKAFGWHVVEIDGHDLAQIEQSLSRMPLQAGRPSCILAHTVKGKGVSFMEGKLLWHYRSPAGEELELARKELEPKA